MTHKEFYQGKMRGLYDDFNSQDELYRLGKVQEAVRFGTTDHLDCVSTMLSIDLGLKLWSSGQKEYGQRIIAGVAQYFNERGICHKATLPVYTDTEAAGQLPWVRNILEEIAGRIMAFDLNDSQSDFTFISNFCTQFTDGLQMMAVRLKEANAKSETHLSIVIPILYNPALRKRPDIEEVFSAYESAQENCNMLGKTLNQQDALDFHKVKKKTRQTDEIINLVAYSTRHTHRSLPDFFQKRFENTSLLQLFHEKDIEKMTRDAVRFFAKASQGDLFWQNVFLHFFMLPAYHVNVGNIPELFGYPEIMKKIFAFQMRLAQKLFLPSIYQSSEAQDVAKRGNIDHLFTEYKTADSVFDREIGELFGNLEPGSLNRFAEILYTAVRAGSLPLLKFYEGNESFDYQEIEFSINQMGLLIDMHEAGKPVNQVFIFIDERNHEFMRTHWRDIHQHLKNRFFGHKNQDAMYRLFHKFADFFNFREFAQVHNTVYIKRMTTGVGERFLDHIADPKQGIDQMIDEIWKNTNSGQDIAYWLNGGVLHPCRFPPESVMQALGFSIVTFVTQKDNFDFIDFSLKPVREGQNLVKGRISTTGKLISFSLDLTENEALQKTILLEISAAFQTLLRREVVVKEVAAKQKPRRVIYTRISEDEEEGEGDDDSERPTKLRRLYERKAPRQSVQYVRIDHLDDYDQALELEQVQDDLTLSISEEGELTRRRTPHPVSWYRRKQPGIEKVLEFFSQFEEAPEGAKQQMFEKLRLPLAQALHDLHKTPEGRIQSAPPPLKPTMIINPWYQLDTSLPAYVYSDTFVQGHWSPTLGELDAPADQLWERAYNLGMDALTFTDYLWKDWSLKKT